MRSGWASTGPHSERSAPTMGRRLERCARRGRRWAVPRLPQLAQTAAQSRRRCRRARSRRPPTRQGDRAVCSRPPAPSCNAGIARSPSDRTRPAAARRSDESRSYTTSLPTVRACARSLPRPGCHVRLGRVGVRAADSAVRALHAPDKPLVTCPRRCERLGRATWVFGPGRRPPRLSSALAVVSPRSPYPASAITNALANVLRHGHEDRYRDRCVARVARAG